jgi:hypothetical protein
MRRIFGPVPWMIGASLLSWAAISVTARQSLNPELWWGMVGPLASAVLTWIAVVRAQRTRPERVTGVLVAGFGAKIVFFGLYLAVMLRVVGVRVVPFALAFVAYVVALYVLEALFLKRLFADAMRSTPGV